MNLRRNRWIGGLWKAKWFPGAAQLLLLAAFLLLVLGGLGATTTDPDLARYLRDTNLANLIVWSYWWPIIIIVAVLFGRWWCTVCPVEFITRGREPRLPSAEVRKSPPGAGVLHASSLFASSFVFCGSLLLSPFRSSGRVQKKSRVRPGACPFGRTQGKL